VGVCLILSPMAFRKGVLVNLKVGEGGLDESD